MTATSILVVDDDDDIRETIVEALSDEGFEAVGASDGAEALRVLGASSSLPALILLDLMMPGMSGPDFLAAQRADPVLLAVPVVLVSADANVGAKAASLGVTEFLRKPVKLDVLIATAKRFSGTDS
ncbi:MAG: response regulator [Kofleriaceae bacterium]|nr:response regulator [Kofleriaceae bacterium]